MKPKVYITSTKNNTKNDLIDAVKACFNQFGGVENIVKGNVFIKINALEQRDIKRILKV